MIFTNHPFLRHN